MIDALIFLAWSYALAWVTWVFYVAIMHLKIVHRSLHPFARLNAYIALAIGLPLDALTNIVVGSLLFLEPPQLFAGRWLMDEGEWLLTARLARHRKHSTGWRQKMAAWLCEHLLNQFDVGHC